MSAVGPGGDPLLRVAGPHNETGGNQMRVCLETLLAGGSR